MERFTQEEALEEIFSKKKLTPNMTVSKHRYKKGELGQSAIDEILKRHNFIVIQRTLYVKA